MLKLMYELRNISKVHEMGNLLMFKVLPHCRYGMGNYITIRHIRILDKYNY